MPCECATPLALGGALSGAQAAPPQVPPQRRPATGATHGGASAGGGGATPKKPQTRWWNEVDNSSRPFVPKLRTKPNALVPLELRLEQPEDPSHALSALGSSGPSGSTQPQQPWYANPYVPEINAFAPSEQQLSAGRERLYAPLHATPCTWIDSEPLLQQMRARLATVT